MRQGAGGRGQGAGGRGQGAGEPGRGFLCALRPAPCALLLTPCALLLTLCVLLLAACASKPKPPLTAPQWDAVPAPVLDALCARLQMDAIASGAPLAILGTTRALATPQSMSALALAGRGGRTSRNRVAASAADANRSLPITTEGTSCTWRLVPASQIDRHRDEMLVEMSAPMLHPFAPRQAGLFARVAVGGEGASWYWISLVPSGDNWSVASVSVLVQ